MKPQWKLLTFFIALFFIASCAGNGDRNDSTPITRRESFKTIIIQPFIGFSVNDATYIKDEIGKVYPHIQINDPIALPSSAFYRERKRYRADSLIHFLSNNTQDGFVTLGLTNKDISTNKGEVADWGVMGLGFQPGNACVASSFRLSKKQTLDQLFKVSIHELGHTAGLPHCSDATCFMRDAEGKNPTDQETRFCEKCKAYLISKGWKFEK